MFIVRLDRLNNEIEFIGAVDLPGHAVILAWRDDLGFGEVVQPRNPSRRVISHGSSDLIVLLSNARRIEVKRGFDADLLVQLVRVLEQV